MNTHSTVVAVKPLRRDAAENRERLLAAASRVFAARGLDAGVEEIAREAGVGMGTLYRRFPSKQALIDELVGGLRLYLLEIARTALDEPDGTGLEQALLGTGELLAEQSGCLQNLWAHSEVGLEAIEEYHGHLSELLESAQASGRIRREVTRADLSVILWSVSGVITQIGAIAPKAWRRHLEVVIAGLRPVDSEYRAAALAEPPLSDAQVRRVTMRARAR